MTQDLFADVYFIADSIEQVIVQQLEENGGTRLTAIQHAPKLATIHFITQDYNSPACIEAQSLPSFSRTHICTPDWVKASLSKQRIQDPRRYSPDPRQFFTGVCVTGGDLPEGDKEAIYGGVMALGGQYSDELVKGTTHVVTMSMDSDVVRRVMQDPSRTVEVVLPHWFDDCLKLRRRVPSDPYRFPNPRVLESNHRDDTPLPLSPEKNFALISDAGLAAEQTPPECFEDIFKGKKVYFGADLSLSARVLTSMSTVINYCNGHMAKNLQTADIYIGKYRDGQEYTAAEHGYKVVGNWLWLFFCLSRGVYSSPREHLLHYPRPRRGLPEFSKYKITVSNYTGEARTYLERLIIQLGAEFTRSMRPDNTHLITAIESGEKFNTAKEWNINCINHLWLEESYASWTAKPVTNSNYVTFPREVHLTDVIAKTPVSQEGIAPFFMEDTEDEAEGTPERDGPPSPIVEADLDEDTQDFELPLIHDVRELSSFSRSDKPADTTNVLRSATPPDEISKVNTPKVMISKRDLTTATPSRLNEATPSSRGSNRKAGQAAASKLRDAMEDANEYGQQMRRKNKLPPLPNEIAPPSKRVKASSPDRPKELARIVLTGCPPLSEQLHKQCTKMGIEIIDDPTQATHLVSPRIARTKKFVVAIPRCPNFVNYEWLTSTIKAKELCSEKDYPLEEAVPAAWSKGLVFRDVLKRAKKLQQTGGLLAGLNILVTDAVCKVGGLETYREIITVNGGTCSLAGRSVLDRNPGNDTILITDGPDDPAILKLTKKSPSLRVHEREWLMTCCIRQEL